MTDGSWWTRVAEEPGGRVVGPRLLHPGRARAADGDAGVEPMPGRAHVSAVFTHPGPLAAGDRGGDAGRAEDAMRDGRLRGGAAVDARARRPRGAFYEAHGLGARRPAPVAGRARLPIVAYVKAL